jgi:colanic acid/amylovoran biosynthesis protein
MLARYYKSRGKPVVLLPQAFGPFERQDTREAFTGMLQSADLVYARDRRSYDYAAALTPYPERLFLAPDITLANGGQAAHPLPPRGGYACLVPNERMMDQGKERWGDTYEAALLQIAQAMLARGIPLRVLVHTSSPGDLRMARHLAEQAASPSVQVVCEPDPLTLKGIIGGSLLLVGSRYHSLVSAFSTGVPSMCLGWSHKYDTLFEEFGCGDLVISPEQSSAQILERVGRLAEPEANAAHRRRILRHLREMRVPNEAMWERVVPVLSRPLRTPVPVPVRQEVHTSA